MEKLVLGLSSPLSSSNHVKRGKGIWKGRIRGIPKGIEPLEFLPSSYLFDLPEGAQRVYLWRLSACKKRALIFCSWAGGLLSCKDPTVSYVVKELLGEPDICASQYGVRMEVSYRNPCQRSKERGAK